MYTRAAHFSSLKMEAAYLFETFAPFNKGTWRHILHTAIYRSPASQHKIGNKLSLFLIKRHLKKEYGGMEV